MSPGSNISYFIKYKDLHDTCLKKLHKLNFNYKFEDILKYYYKSLKKIEIDGKLKKYNSKNEKYLLNICKNIIV